MPEGLTPVSLARFDGAIEHIVRDFTLQGVSVLAHCRGGVGRAGLVACAWALKMGLVPETGEVPSFAMAASASYTTPVSHPNGGDDDEEERFLFGDEHGAYARADLQIARDVISVIRRRRSVKAIETYEQVRWVVNYVRRLREGREAVAAPADNDAAEDSARA
jgi:protein-tyrosine phosphatase